MLYRVIHEAYYHTFFVFAQNTYTTRRAPCGPAVLTTSYAATFWWSLRIFLFSQCLQISSQTERRSPIPPTTRMIVARTADTIAIVPMANTTIVAAITSTTSTNTTMKARDAATASISAPNPEVALELSKRRNTADYNRQQNTERKDLPNRHTHPPPKTVPFIIV